MEGEPGPLRSSEKQGVGHHTQARALWLREKAKAGIVGASNLVEKQVVSPRPVKTQNSLEPKWLEPKGNFTPPLGLMRHLVSFEHSLQALDLAFQDRILTPLIQPAHVHALGHTSF